jgi:hypothetical protein
MEHLARDLSGRHRHGLRHRVCGLRRAAAPPRCGLQHRRPVFYYAYLRSAVHDGDLDFTNDYQLFRHPDGSLDPPLRRIDPVTRRPDNNYTVGLPLLVAPFYAVCNVLLASWYPASGAGSGFPLFLDQLIFSYGGLVLGFFGMWLSFKFVCFYFPERESLGATIAFWLCSPLLYYFCREPFMSHLAAIFAVSLFLYVWKVPSLSGHSRAPVMGVAAALATMVRIQDSVIVLIPVGSALIDSAWTRARRTPVVGLLLFGLGFAAAFAVQVLVWHTLRGSLLTFPYRGQSFPYLLAPRIGQVLFSSNHGLITWHPLTALCLLGLVRFSRSAPALGWLALACVVLELYVIASWWCWWMGNSFGGRGFLGLTPLFILGLAAFAAGFKGRWRRRLLAAVVAVLFLWNVTLMFTYLSEMIPYQGDFSWRALIGALPDIPSRILEKMRRV